jgi:protein TonB
MTRKRLAPAFAAVLLLHCAVLWALQQGLLQRTSEPVAPAEMLVEITLSEPAPATLPATQQQPTKRHATEPAKPLLAQPRQPSAPPPPPQKPEPVPVAVAAALPSPMPTPAAAPAPQSTSTAPANPAATSVAIGATASSAQVPGTANPPPAPALQLPSSDADYLRNPTPSYPAMSRRLGEQGNVLVQTLIGADGVPQKALILRSSGFERLDRAALETAMKWRYVPGMRAGVAEAMWFKVPLRFVLD